MAVNTVSDEFNVITTDYIPCRDESFSFRFAAPDLIRGSTVIKLNAIFVLGSFSHLVPLSVLR